MDLPSRPGSNNNLEVWDCLHGGDCADESGGQLDADKQTKVTICIDTAVIFQEVCLGHMTFSCHGNVKTQFSEICSGFLGN